MPSRENKDGSLTTWADDVEEPKASTEAKVVAPEDEKPAPKARSRAESK